MRQKTKRIGPIETIMTRCVASVRAARAGAGVPKHHVAKKLAVNSRVVA